VTLPPKDLSRHAAWLVDLDGTLYHARWLKLAMLSELSLFGAWNAPILRKFRHEHERLRIDPPNGSTPYTTQLERTATATGRSVSEIERITTRWMIERPLKWLKLFRRETLIAEVAAYRAVGGRTALVSDYPAAQKLQALGCAELFDVVVANGEANGPPHLKPKPDGYLRAAQLLGVSPEKCLVIGDRPDADGAAAKAANMDFFLV